MFSTPLKQSVATLGVVAGLLAAAGPANAKSVSNEALTIKGAVFRGELVGLEPTVKAPAKPTSEVFTSVSNVAPPTASGATEARPRGFEPLTFGSVDRRSIQLSYGRSGTSVATDREPTRAERAGFEPAMELSAPYSLSRRVPSATRPPLRGWGAV